MVKAERKPLEEIKDSIKRYKRILTVGCGGCVSVCLVGGQKEVNLLNAELNVSFKADNSPKQIDGYTVERQCNAQYLEELDYMVDNYDCILSMACGAGVQHLAERFPGKPVFPGVNTVAIGIDKDIGMYEERCRACGECVLAYTAGICPVTRCAKGLFNGPCGGTNSGKCEVSDDIPCAWYEIYNRLEKQGRLEDIMNIRPPMQWQNTTLRTIIQEPYKERYAKEE
ncbi:MAG: methylenetetrahydrofolate reductase C-terminal domain-containing protein [Deltaproteobacteria bacterium]|nr:methylenetetrahydrofolate reductase C-terminal domain-containing protein [Deltaproteobacteria bacterium]MBW1939794.1 methylenetetrahydrofolate reductase C-terminal domain-containing protein [Deltaproteobacteria bacterium]MBW2010190.1 methylenetetrahydrofolate reductase C-terminal domain-containing protein [Deltaproteobacteria bacterium]MBW2099264.1 methylenetetrahydrofolate reductase C-terminal domain-containing protein [Deltaproteobacteria bacterium]